MTNDPIVEEVRKERDSHAAKLSYDLKAMYEDIKKQEKESNRTFVSLPPKYTKESA